ncbi:MAG TPA: ATP-binding cassette domain-containing protein [candidate division WOR-3 bacterium]|uniref:ATP-binding cassette domain-containing protein n=1 Tax=candidate division WOR-3 bacterium TaxID=2052148 RepID=A0A9C9EMV1_UNCW3|nr:ATP-binding cassette domain-containing protein [candidate division WOR-3 bacterium]
MIRVRNLSKRFDSLIVLDDVSFDVEEAKLVVILGPSGTGKTVLLKSILGLIPVDSGEVYFDERVVQSAGKKELYEIRKEIGFVFQGTALFDSMNIMDNIALPLLEHTRMSASEIKKKVMDIMEIIGLPGKEGLFPPSLSGGMKRLVAVGRALALDPKYIFYDEPTTGLDPVMRERVVELIINLKSKYSKSGIVVTHDLDTARAVGDDIYMLKKGKINKLKEIGKDIYNG